MPGLSARTLCDFGSATATYVLAPNSDHIVVQGRICPTMQDIIKAVKEVKVVCVPEGSRHVGEYTTDNLVAERSIRNMTIHRKNSLFFCSDKGERNSAIYLTSGKDSRKSY